MMKFKRNRPTIGILMGHSVLSVNTPDHYRSTILKGIQSAACARECNVLLGWSLMSSASDLVHLKPAWPIPSPDSSFVPIGPWNTDGMIVFAPLQNDTHSQYLQDLRQQGYPVLLIATGEDAPTISVRNETGIYQAVEHMAIFHGHHHIGFIAGHPDDKGDSDVRLRAFQGAVADYGLDPDPRLIAAGMHTVPGGYRAAQTMLQSGVQFTALIASNDASAIGAIQAIRATTSLQIPRDVAIIGFDDQPDAIAQVPPLASIHTPLLEIGQQAVTLMSDYLNGIQELESIQLPTRLIPRQSCGCLPQSMHSASASKSHNSRAGGEADLSAIQHEITNGMLSVLPHSLRYPFGERTSRLCNSLVEGFYTSLKTENAISFQEKLMDFLQELELRDENTDAWQNTISSLRQDMTGLPVDWQRTETKQLAENMLHEARCAISESVQRQIYRNRYHQQIAEQTLSEITSRLSAILDEQQAVEILEENLANFGIKHVRVALFEAEENDPFAWSIVLNPRSEIASQHFPTRSFPPPGLYPEGEALNVMILPLTFHEEAFGYIAFDTSNLDPCATVARQLASTFKTSRLHKQVTELSLKDPLTGVYNRRYFDLFLNNEVNRSARLGHEVAIIMADIDHFKKYNDSFGHPAGDKAIQSLALCIKEDRRSTDVAARIGGDEFALILPGTNLEGARIVAEKIQSIVRTSTNFEHPITVSMGISVLSGAEIEAEALIKEADTALYEAKQTGRNRICVFEKPASQKKVE
ncbi:MAG TPA: GGDEF domain-containing protein [Anaerolineales bacterium]|nr:GGDEF domain-containing protein [Anaerolineales bacterium]